MKMIIQYYLSIILVYFLAGINAKNQMLPENPSQMSKEEFKNFKSVMEEALLEYEKLNPDEKQGVIEQMKTYGVPGSENLTIEELDKSMKDTALMLSELEKNIIGEKIEEERNSLQEKKIIENKSSEKNEKKNNSLIHKIEEVLNSSIRTLGKLSFKIQDEHILEEFTKEWITIREDIDRIVYYLKTIKEFLSNNKEKTIFLEELKLLLFSLEKINSIEASTESLISFDEYESREGKKNLSQKYNIPPSSKNLCNYLETEIEKIKKNIEELEKKEKNKNILTQIRGLEYQIDILEKDLLEATIEKEKNNINSSISYKKTIKEVIKKIDTIILTSLQKDHLITRLEEIIKKYFPEEYKKGKEKENILKAQIQAEKSIKNQKKSSGDMFLEKSFRSESFQGEKNFKEDSYQQNNSFNFEPIESRHHEYERYDDAEEKNAFEHTLPTPQEYSINHNKNNEDPESSEKNISKQSTEEKNYLSKEKSIVKKKKKHSKEKNKKNKDKQEEKKENEKIETEEKKNTSELSNILDLVQNTLTQFIENKHKGYNSNNNKKLKNFLEENSEKIRLLCKDISTKDIQNETSSDKNILNKYKNMNKDLIPVFFSQELEKANLLELDINSYSDLQHIYYQMEEVFLIFNTKFQTKENEKDLKNLSELIETYKDIREEYKKIVEKLFESTKKITKPYWLKTKDEIEKEIKEKSENNNTQKIKE